MVGKPLGWVVFPLIPSTPIYTQNYHVDFLLDAYIRATKKKTSYFPLYYLVG